MGIPADILDLDGAITRASSMLQENRPHFIASVNPEICMASQKDEMLKSALTNADLGIPDGIGVVLASRLRRGRLRSRVTGIDMMEALVELAVREGKSIFLFGAAEGVAEEAAANLMHRHPGLRVAGTQHGYIPPSEEGRAAEKIASSGADIVFVGLGSPRQELFAARHAAATGARVLMVVGGSFDVFSGRLQRAPQFYQRFGLEWLYRLIQQPERLQRTIALPRFLLLTVLKKN